MRMNCHAPAAGSSVIRQLAIRFQAFNRPSYWSRTLLLPVVKSSAHSDGGHVAMFWINFATNRYMATTSCNCGVKASVTRGGQ